MPLVNYCKKCKAEVPDASVCPYCGAKLTNAGKRLAFTRKRLPVTDWFAWNAMLRVVLPVLLLVVLVTVLAEAFTEGAAGVRAVFIQGFFWVVIAVLAGISLFTLIILLLQGRETVRYVLDKTGAHVYAYLDNPKVIRLYARLLTRQTVETLMAEAPKENREGLSLIRKTELPWAAMARAQFWPETHTVLLYRPFWWQAVCIRCGETEYGAVSDFVMTKLPNGRARKKKKETGIWAAAKMNAALTQKAYYPTI